MKLFGEGPTVHAGTYNANPLAMAGTVAALDALAAEGGALLEQAHARGRALWRGLAELAEAHRLPLQLRGAPGVFSTSFVPEGVAVTDFRSARQADARLLDRFWRDLHHGGVQFTAFGIWFLCTAHTEADITETLAAADKSLGALAVEEG